MYFVFSQTFSATIMQCIHVCFDMPLLRCAHISGQSAEKQPFPLARFIQGKQRKDYWAFWIQCWAFSGIYVTIFLYHSAKHWHHNISARCDLKAEEVGMPSAVAPLALATAVSDSSSYYPLPTALPRITSLVQMRNALNIMQDQRWCYNLFTVHCLPIPRWSLTRTHDC